MNTSAARQAKNPGGSQATGAIARKANDQCNPLATDTAVKKAKVVILEDESTVADRLQAKLQEFGNIEPTVVSDMLQFSKVIESDEFDAASIDWEVHDVYKGPEAIKLMSDTQPDAAKVVNTKHEVEGQARYLKVDAVLRKQRDLDDFLKVMNQAIRLGLARQISRSLREFDLSDLPDLSPGNEEMITADAELIIHTEARKKVFQLKISDHFEEPVNRLTDLLQRRGWWQGFDVENYTKMSKRDKLKNLVECAEISTEELAEILEVDPQVAVNLNSDEERIRPDSLVLLERQDDLLSILAFVLRLSDYDPELVSHFWRVKNFYKGSLDSPPWDPQGLSGHLRANGHSGIIESLTWIRSY